MPYSQTKNTQSPDNILKMVNHCFQTAYFLNFEEKILPGI